MENDGPIEDGEAALKLADSIGYPVLVKAASGGGGRGMRRAANPDELRDGLETASGEAKSAFGDGTVYIEKLLTRPQTISVTGCST